MSKIFAVIFSLLTIITINILILTKPVIAAVDPPVCGTGIGVTYEPIPKPIPENQPAIVMKFSGLSDGWYRLRFAGRVPNIHVYTPEIQALNGEALIFINRDDEKLDYKEAGHQATLEKSNQRTGPWAPFCKDVKYFVGYKPEQCRIAISPSDPTDLEQIRIDIADMPVEKYFIVVEGLPSNVGEIQIDNFGKGTTTIGPFSPLTSTLSITSDKFFGQFCKIPFVVKSSAGQSPRPLPSGSGSPIPPAKVCSPKDPTCTSAGGKPCDSSDPSNPGIRTAIGCIHTSPAGFVKDFLKFALGIGGGLAFLMMLLGAFQMVTSAGNPETLAAGKDRLTSALIGLLFIIFAVLLLQIIGVDILRIPEFKES